MEIKVSKKDITWNYIGIFFNIGSSFVILPLILNRLTVEEIGINYLLMTLGSLVALADFGFSGQFGRNITYVFSGAKKLRKEGLRQEDHDVTINYHLLAVVIATAKSVYRRLSILVLLLMLTLGTLYIYHATGGFNTIDNIVTIWLLYCISTFFNIYYLYYSSLLSGAALIVENRKGQIASRLVYIFLSYILLLCGFGLISVVIANLVAPFVIRFYSYYVFYYQNGMKQLLNKEKVTKIEISETFSVLWFNAKKLGINFIGSYGISQSGIFLAGLYLSLEEVASYGLMLQSFNIISGLSTNLFNSYLPMFFKYRVDNDKTKLVNLFSMAMFTQTLLMILGLLSVILLGPQLLKLIKSNAELPAYYIIIIYGIDTILSMNHANFATMIVSKNEVPFVGASIISGCIILFVNFLTLKFTTLGVLGLVVGRFVVQSSYNHWKWPKWVLDDFNISPGSFLRCGIDETIRKVTNLK